MTPTFLLGEAAYFRRICGRTDSAARRKKLLILADDYEAMAQTADHVLGNTQVDATVASAGDSVEQDCSHDI